MKWYTKVWVWALRIGARLYMYSVLKIFSFVFNSYYYLKMVFTGKLGEARRIRKSVAKSITDISALNTQFNRFSYIYDGLTTNPNPDIAHRSIFSMWPTWIATMTVFMYRGFQDNCDTSAKYAKWLFKQLKKNNPEYAKKYEGSIEIYMPYTLKKMFKYIHYIYVAKTVHDSHKWTAIYSNGNITLESKDNLAVRYLKGDNKYFWI